MRAENNIEPANKNFEQYLFAVNPENNTVSE